MITGIDGKIDRSAALRWLTCTAATLATLTGLFGMQGLPMTTMSTAMPMPSAMPTPVAVESSAAHPLVSVILRAVIILVGLSLRSVIASRTDLIVGPFLILTGLAFLIAEATGYTHRHDGLDGLDGYGRCRAVWGC